MCVDIVRHVCGYRGCACARGRARQGTNLYSRDAELARHDEAVTIAKAPVCLWNCRMSIRSVRMLGKGCSMSDTSTSTQHRDTRPAQGMQPASPYSIAMRGWHLQAWRCLHLQACTHPHSSTHTNAIHLSCLTSFTQTHTLSLTHTHTHKHTPAT
jgi:hypothetical protein